MARPQKVTDNQISDALRACGGVLATAACKLGITRQGLSKRLRDSQSLRDARDESTQEILDCAERELFKAVHAGKPWAIRFLLTRLGRGRGYGASIDVESGAGLGRVVVYLPDDGREAICDSSLNVNGLQPT